MPLDTRIPLAIDTQPVATRSPLDLYGKVLDIKGQQQQLAGNEEILAAKRAEAARLAQKAEIDARDTKNLSAAIVELGGDPDKLEAWGRRGLSAPAYMKLRESLTAERKTLAEIKDKELAGMKYRDELLGGMIDEATKETDEQYLANWGTRREQAKALGLKLPEQPIDKSQLPLYRSRFVLSSGLQEAEARRRGLTADALKKEIEADVAAATKTDTIAQAGAEADKAINEAVTSAPNESGLTAEQQQKADEAAATLKAAGYTADQKDYDRAVKDGAFKGNFVEYQTLMANLKRPSTTVNVNTQSMQRATPVINKIAELSKKINTGEGVSATATGMARTAASKLNYDNDVAQYNRLIEGAIPLVARAMGHTGVLTQQDVDSVRAMFPKPGDSQELADALLANVDAILNANGSGTPMPTIPKVGDTFQGGKVLKIEEVK